MKMITDKFIFTNQITDIEDNNTFIAYIPKVETKLELIHIYYDVMRFPPYFGFNWDALYDCLTDLYWIEEKNIIVIHKHLPNLDKKNLVIYFEILSNAVDYWKNTHTLKVIFPIRTKEIIENSIQN